LACTAAIAVAASLPLWRVWCTKARLVDQPGERKIHEQPVPLAGGLAVMTGLLVGLLALAVAMRLGILSGEGVAKWNEDFAQRAGQLGAALLGAVAMLALGLLDDKFDLRPSVKLAGQALSALSAMAAGVRFNFFPSSMLLDSSVTLLWILTVTNAVNFSDNMNGLCAGLGAIAALGFGLSAAISGQAVPALLAFVLAGALAGFLPYNFPRASVFLGDSGSHLTGYCLGMLAILSMPDPASHANLRAALKPLFLLAVPLADLVQVVLVRLRLGKPVYLGDTNHLSHRLVNAGLGRAQAVLLLWLAGAVTAALGLLL
jgi:UDP-GlcNAc:undecaprenyl-phosphate GlcNAc-1-phosphate transferase